MKDKICTIMKQPSEVIKGSTFDKLIKRWPQAAFHDKVNRLFNSIDEDAFDPLMVSSFKDADGEELTGDALVTALAPYLFSDNRERPIHIRKSVLIDLYNNPAYQLYCGNYETIEELSVDRILVGFDPADDSKTLEELNEESRILLKAALV
jgi:hypothetical protein